MSWRTGQMVQDFIATPVDDLVVAPMELGPGLLEQHHPELGAVGSRQHWLTVEARDEVINYHKVWEAIFVHSDGEDTLWTDILGDEEPSDKFRLFSQSGYATEQSGVSELPGHDVCRIDGHSEYLWLSILVEAWDF